MSKKRIAIFGLVAALLFLSVLFGKQVKEQKQVELYVEWLSGEIEQLEDVQEIVATVGTQTITENDIRIYSLLAAVNSAYHDHNDPEAVYTSEQTIEEAFLTIIHDTVYSAYASDSDIPLPDSDCDAFADRQIEASLHSNYANQKAIATIEKEYPSYFKTLFRNLYAQNEVNHEITDGIQDAEQIGQTALDFHMTLLQTYSVSVFRTAPECIYEDDFIDRCFEQGIQIDTK